MSRPVIVFDSGMGGLTVLAAIRRALPQVDCLYVADDAGFPYGALDEGGLTDRVVTILSELIRTRRPDAVVIACNSAATLVLPPLRARFVLPFVGTVPAIKPAAAATRSGLVSVLATAGTVARDYTKALIAEFAAHCAVNLVAAPDLAPLAEEKLAGRTLPAGAVAAAIAPAFVELGGKQTDVVVLACTHYPLLIEELTAAATWPVLWIDPSPAIARRLANVLGEEVDGTGTCEFLMTSGGAMPPRARETLAALIDKAFRER